MRLLDSVRQDCRHAVRILLQNPGFTAIAVLSLALGIGANMAIFTLIDAVLLRSLPVREPERLVSLAINPEKPLAFFSYPAYEYIREHNHSFSGVVASAGANGFPAAFAVPEEGSHASAQLATLSYVSGNYFQTLGVTPAIGRLLTPEDNVKEGGHPWIVLDYDFWQRRFGGDPQAIGRKVTLNGSVFTIVGVARSGFSGTMVGNHPDVYLPIMMQREISGASNIKARNIIWLNLLARLKPGVTMQAAIPEMDLLWNQYLADDPQRRPVPTYALKDYGKHNRGMLLAGSGGYSILRDQIRKPLAVLMVVVALVLLIASANVANLLLARATARQREIAIRLAVGAGRARLIRQLVLETLVVSIAGGIAGLAFAWWGVRVLLTFLPKRFVAVDLNLSPDWQLLTFSFGVSLAVGMICGMVPALQSTRPDLISELKSEGKALGRSRFDLRRALVITQVAISLLLLIGAGLFVRSLQNLRSLDPGFVRESVLVVSVYPERSGYKGQRLRDFYERLLEKARALPNSRSASLAGVTPLSGSRSANFFAVEGYRRRPDESPLVDLNSVGTGYFETLRIPILVGRDFRADDNPSFSPPVPVRNNDPLGPPAPVAIVNETFARHFFPNQNPLGKHLTQGEEYDPARSFEIVGIVKDAKYFGVRDAVESMIYLPVWRMGAGGKALCIRSTGRPAQLIGAIRREVANIDPGVPVLQTLTMEEQFDNTISQERTVTTLSGFFGVIAVVLAAIGLYGVMAQAVTRRYREIGIRMALGAKRSTVLWLVLRDTALMIGIGAAIGLPAAFALTRLVQSFLYGLTPQDPANIAVATAALVVVTGLAGYIPARRATKVDPMIALRYE